MDALTKFKGEIVALNRQYLTLATILSKEDCDRASMILGLPKEIVRHLSTCTLEDVHLLTEGVTNLLFVTRINDATFMRLRALTPHQRGLFVSTQLASSSSEG